MDLRREVRLALVVALTAVPSVGRADGDLTVLRHESATQCPEGDELRRLALASVAPSSPPPTHAYRVSFERSRGSYRAEIVDGTAGRSRRLEDSGADCAALAQAAAVVVATMWGSEHDEASPMPATTPSVTEATTPTTRVDRDSRSGHPGPPRPRKSRWVFGAGGALTAAIVRPLAPAWFADGALEFAHTSLTVGVLWIPPQRIDVAPGSIDVRLVAGSLRACTFLGDATEVGVCAKLIAGQLDAAGAGYSSNAQRGRPWFAIEPEVFVDRLLLGPVRSRAAAGATIPLHAEAFYVTGAGTAYDTPAVGALVLLSLELATP